MAHAKLCSPSGSEGWFACPGRPVMEAPFPDDGGEEADDGTARHLVCGSALMEGKDVADYVGREIVFWSHPESDSSGECFAEELTDTSDPNLEILKTVEYKDDWVEEDQDYVNDVRRRVGTDGILFVEQKVNFEEYTGVVGDSFGTLDAAILAPLSDTETGERTGAYMLTVEDRKTGYKRVPVERNKQLMLYALGAYFEHSLAYEITRIVLVIHQREAQEWECTVEELLEFAEKELRPAAQRVVDAVAAAEAEDFDPETWNVNYLNPEPSEKACAFCRAQSVCPSLQRRVQDAVAAFPDIVDASSLPVPSTGDSPEFLSRALTAVPLIEDWCKALRAEVLRRLQAGEAIPDFKLVQGKQGARKWRDPKAAEAYMKKIRMKADDIYDRKLISPTTAEKHAKAEILRPGQWEALQELITRAPGSVSVAPESDKRPAIQSSVDAFDVLPSQDGATPSEQSGNEVKKED